MMRNRWPSTLLALALGAAGGAITSEAAEFRCANGDLIRRVEVIGTDTPQDTFCEVRYWRNAAQAHAGQSLWRSDRDPEYCAARARELIARLESGGWRCASAESATRAADPAAGPPAQAEPPPADAPERLEPVPEPGFRVSELESRDVAIAAEPIAPAASQAAPSAGPVGPPSPVAQPQPNAAPARPSTLPAIAGMASPLVAQSGPPVTPAAPPPSPAIAHAAPPQSDHPPPATSAHPDAALLDRVVEQTLRSVQELYGGRFEADLAAFGDLDRDGLRDAAVLVTYQADRQEHVQYLVAYLFDGEAFRSVATKNVGGRFLDAVRADLRGIVDGRILVELEALDEGANCCARHRTAFALENGQLVQVADPDAAGLERTGDSGRPAPG